MIITKPNSSSSQWRVNIDVSGNNCVVDSSKKINELVEWFVSQNIEVAIIDVDKSKTKKCSIIIEDFLLKYPSQLWYGGGIQDADEIEQLLLNGAAGVVVGGALFKQNRFNCDLIEKLLCRFPTKQILFSLDYKDNDIYTNAFTQKTKLMKNNIIETMAKYADGLQIALVDINASQKKTDIDMEYLNLLKNQYTKMRFWYAGNIRTWKQIRQLHKLGISAIIGQNYLLGQLGLEEY